MNQMGEYRCFTCGSESRTFAFTSDQEAFMKSRQSKSATLASATYPHGTGVRSLALLHAAAILLLALLGGTVFCTRVHAQTSYGGIVGTVTDSTGATVPGAQVTLKNMGTEATQKATTSNGGTYTFINLNPGSYSVTVNQSGFESYTQNGIDVQIGGATRVDLVLQIGNVSQSVTVTAAATGLQTDSASLSGVIEGRQVVDAPLNGRNVNNLLDFVPGVTPGGGTQGSTMANGGSGSFQAGGQTQAIAYGNYQIGGAFSGQSLFFIDGVGSNISENNVNTLVPTQDAVQEFRVSTNDVSAEFGGYGGGVVQISTKSGTNTFHGNAYEYVRNTDLDANDWFSNHEGLGKSPLHQNQYGVNIGGPAFKNKLFFFFSWEHESLISASPISATVPTTAELNGDFSGDPQTVYCPAVGSYGCAPGQPLPGNKLTYIDPTALAIAKLETPAESRVTQTPYTTNFFASAPIEGYQNQYNARIDANLGKDNVFARYTFWNPHNGDSDPFGTKTGAGPTGNYTQEAVLGDSHVFNPTTIAELRLSYLENYNFQYPLSDGFDMSSISSAYGTIQSESENKEGLLPGLGIQGYGIGAELSQLYWNNNVWAISGSATKILGKHTIKAGGNWRQVLWENYHNSQGLGIGTSTFFTASSPTDPTTGNGLASFLLGIPSSTGISSVGTWHAFLHNYGLFVEDTWQATQKLTVIAGLRWEQPGSYSEENNLDSILQPNAPVTIGGLSSITNPVSGSTVPLTGQLAFVDSSAYSPRREEALHWMLYSPRLGIAYRFDPKTVLRSGYGISFFPAEITADSPGNSPINSAGTGLSNTPGQPLLATVDNPLPNGINLPTGRTQAGLDAALGQGIGGRIPHQAYGYSQQWNLALERSIDAKSTATVAYAGSKGTHLILSGGFTGTGLNLNQLPDSYDSLGNALLTQVPNPFFGILPSGITAGQPTIAEGYLLEPHPQYESVSQVVPRYGDSTYHALQLTYIRRFNHGGVLQGAYTWSKLLSNTDNTSSFQDGQGGLGVVQDNENLKAEKSLSQQDLANNVVINYGLDLPFGHGEEFLSHVNGAANQVIGGWRVDGITTFRSGLPLALLAQGNGLSQFGAGNIRPDYTAGCSKGEPGSPHSAARANEWFNTGCFTQPGHWAFGDEPRVDPGIRSEGEDNFDVSINKSFDLTDNVKLKFSSEIFDLFNHAQFAEPNTISGSPGFGQISHQINPPRNVQFALRLSF
jgi:outer membrane receptor protein involved in Fe transport